MTTPNALSSSSPAPVPASAWPPPACSRRTAIRCCCWRAAWRRCRP
ncbi:hypothetical protein WJ972_18835 [Achromobacter insuavis]